MISYYDLLGLLKDNKHPSKVRLFLCGKSELYEYSEKHTSYILANLRRPKKEPCFDIYLRDSITDLESFDKIIKIEK